MMSAIHPSTAGDMSRALQKLNWRLLPFLVTCYMSRIGSGQRRVAKLRCRLTWVSRTLHTESAQAFSS